MSDKKHMCVNIPDFKPEPVSPAPAQPPCEAGKVVRRFKTDLGDFVMAECYDDLKSDYASLSAELERVKQELIKYMGWFDAAQQNETLFKQQLSAAREALETLLKRIDFISHNWAGSIAIADLKVELEYDKALAALNRGK